ncbi:MAG: 50S ribosomal protein L9 [Pseudomonadota bacterium]
MEVILLERIERLGQMGDVVRVKPGYARNYLLPKQKALRATKDNLAHFETQRAQLETRNLELRTEAEKVAEKVDGTKIVVIRQAGESGQLYGSVSARDIAESLTADGFSVDKSQVAIDRPIKTLGLFGVRITLHPEVASSVTVNVARSAEEAEMQDQRGGMITADILDAEEREADRAAAEAAINADLLENPEEAEAAQAEEEEEPQA